MLGRRGVCFLSEALEGRRLLAGIALDLNYGSSGHAVHDLATPGIVPDFAVNAVMQPDESVVVVGNSGGWVVARYTPAGQLDAGFATGGIARLAGGQVAYAVARQGDGKLVVGGNVTSTAAAVARYLPDGSPDPSFGSGGVASAPGLGEIRSVALLPDGKILAGGLGGGSGAVWRFNPDGSPDTTFGNNGVRIVSAGLVNIHFTLPDGRFVAGTANQGLTRFAADGSSQLVYGGDYADVERQPDGKLVGVGRLNGSSVRVSRFNDAGGLDSTFGTAGDVVVTVGVGSTGGAVARDLSVLPDGKILVGADSRHNLEGLPETYEDIVLTRLNPDGSLDQGFGVGGRYVQALTDGSFWGYYDSLRELLPTPDGRRLVVVGVTTLRAPADGAGTNENHSLSRYALDVPLLVVDGGGPYGPVNEGAHFAVSAAGSSYSGGMIVGYEWDTNYNARAFIPEAAGPTATLTLPDDEQDLVGKLVLRVTTSDGLQALSQPVAVDVVNVAPTAQVSVDGAAVFGVSTTIQVALTDPGADSFTGTTTFGDGKSQTFSTNNRTLFPSNTYSTPGTYPIQVNSADDDGGTGTATGQIVVNQIGGTVYDDDAPRVGTTRAAWGAGVSVYLDLDRDGMPGAAEPTAVTDANGDFGFNGLATGDYRVAVVPPPDTLPSQPDGGYVDVTVTSTKGGVAGLGLTRKPRASGLVFLDADGDGTRDPGEGPAPTWSQFTSRRVDPYLDLDRDGARDGNEPRAVTDPAVPGVYVFRGLAPGTYEVRLYLESNSIFTQTYPAGGGALTFTVPAGPPQAVGVPDEFGVQPLLPAITGSIYDDVDGIAGRSTSGEEPWLARWTMYDDLDGDAAFDAGEPTAVSDSNGAFRFNNVALGAHRIRPLLPPGWLHTSNVGGSVSITGAEEIADAGSFGVRHETDRTLPTVVAVTQPPGVDAQGRRLLAYGFDEPLGDTSIIKLRISRVPGPTYIGDAEVVGYDPTTFAMTFALPTGLASGDYSALLLSSTVTDAVGNPMRSDPTHYFTLDAAAPAVTGVFVGSTAWNTAYRDSLAANGTGEAAFGYRIVAAEQTRTMAWSNLNQVCVRFSENVVVAQNDLVVGGVNVASYGINTFAYDPATFTATWTLAQAIPNDKVTLTLDAAAGTGVTDAALNRLDGEWTDPVHPSFSGDTFPSGDGTAGGNFVFNIRVLPGDIDRNGAVNIFDFNVLKPNLNLTGVGVLGGDINGDDTVNIFDFNDYKPNLGKTTPN